MKYLYYILLTVSFLFFGSCSPKTTASIVTEAVPLAITDPAPVFTQLKIETEQRVAKAISEGIVVPIPKDMGGGYTHEKHKQNYRELQEAGLLYSITKDEKYAIYIKEMFNAYASIFKSLPIHPTDRSYATGKIFWQCLNDANWMVYGSQAYAAIYDYLSSEERAHIENEFLRPYADFVSIENPQFFNRIHNHSTWGNAAVGMVGLAIKDDDLVQRALYGLQLDEVDHLAKDNDGGFVFEKGKSVAGFLAQIDFAFSPDGYYEEGPYYQRYAMLPFMVFADALNKQKPEIEIFKYRDGILVKAVKALLYQTTQDHEFFPINDAQKGMSIHPNSVVTAVNVAYGASPEPIFVSMARMQNTVLLNDTGKALATAIALHDANTFTNASIELRDGAKGDKGALGILRAGSPDRQTTVVFKYTSQGLGHGHFDKLGYLLYDGNTEVLQDYGAARWVNIDQKAGGRYLPENKTWAKQTIAHNTLVVDKKSHFDGNYDKATHQHSQPLFFNTNNQNALAACANEVNAYEGVEMNRILLLMSDDYFDNPLTIDYFTAISDEEHTYDMPYQFAGQIMSQNFDYKINHPEVMGDGHGYQHLYQEAKANLIGGLQMNWFKDYKFYTLTTNASKNDQAILARIGANDPNFNLRRDALLIHRQEGVKNAKILSVIENHGTYSPVTEVPINPYSKIESVAVQAENDATVSFKIIAKKDFEWIILVNKSNGETSIQKQIKNQK